MSGPVQIAPSLLAADLSRLAEEVHKLEKAGADVLHWDIMDGRFVPNLTFGASVMGATRKLTALPFDAHLMVEAPDDLLEDFAKQGCNWLSVHVEVCKHLHRTLSRIKELGMRPGVVLNPATPISSIEPALDFVDYVLVMSVNPGFGGQSFIPQSLEKIRALKKLIGNRKVDIQVDGGIKTENAKSVIDAGANILVVGTGILGKPDYKKVIDELKKL